MEEEENGSYTWLCIARGSVAGSKSCFRTYATRKTSEMLVKAIAEWILSTGRLGMYRLYSKVIEENLSRDEVVATTKLPKAKKRKKDQPDQQPGHKPQRFLTEMWTERMVPAFAHTSVQLPEYTWGKESIGWEVVAADYGPKHGNRRFQTGRNVGNPIVVSEGHGGCTGMGVHAQLCCGGPREGTYGRIAIAEGTEQSSIVILFTQLV